MTKTTHKIPDGWREVRLEKIADLVTDSWKVGNENLPYIGLEHIEENKLRLNSIGLSDEINSNKYIFTEETFLFGKLRPYFRKLFKPNFKGICSTDIWVVKAKENIDKNWLFYLFANQEFVNLSYHGASGTRMPRANWGFVKKTKWLLPPLPEQKAIAEVLSSLDDKIDLLHRQNKTLENMAQALFRKWFIDNPERERWEKKPLGEIVDVINGYSYKGKELVENSNVALVTLKNFGRDGTFQKRGFKPFSGSPKKTQEVKKGDLIVAHTDLTQNADVLGNPALVFEDGGFEKLYITMDLVKIVPKDNNIPKSFLYFLMKTIEFKSHCVEYANGSTVLHLSKKAIPNFVTPLPNDFEKIKNKIQLFDDIVSKIARNQSQIRILENLRDTLLPKLMSGEVGVQDFSK